MTNHELEKEVERIVRRSEVRAVAEAIRDGRRPKVGDVLDYTIELAPDRRTGFHTTGRSRSRDRYQFVVEQWHLHAAYQESSDNACSW